MKRAFLRLSNWCSEHIRAIIHWAALFLIGVGLGWWVHPGAGLMTMGLIMLSLGVWGRWLMFQRSVADA